MIFDSSYILLIIVVVIGTVTHANIIPSVILVYWYPDYLLVIIGGNIAHEPLYYCICDITSGLLHHILLLTVAL